eukprot:7786186-Pyramimonas_sp.AAC.1
MSSTEGAWRAAPSFARLSARRLPSSSIADNSPLATAASDRCVGMRLIFTPSAASPTLAQRWA